MTTPSMGALSKEVGSTGRRMTLFGVITICLGVAAIAAPAIAGLSIVVSVGVLVILGGILRMLWAFAAESFGKGLLAFAIGGLTLLCGLMLVTHPLFSFGFLTILIAFGLFADGLADIAGAFRVRPASGWGWLLLGGIASIVLGAMIWRQFPLSGGWAIGVLLGIRLLFAGIAMLTVGSAARTVAKGMTGAG